MNKFLIGFVVVFCTAALVQGSPQCGKLWTAWKGRYSKLYGSAEEEQSRQQAFCHNAKMVAQHNIEASMGLHSYEMELNLLSDMTSKEIQTTMMGFTPSGAAELDAGILYAPNPRAKVPDAVDWRDYGAVTGVKFQGKCGDCWAFASTGALEGAYFLSNHSLLSFSEQQLVDCNTDCNGCHGGNFDRSFMYWKRSGADLETDYTYHAEDGNCSSSEYKAYTKISNFYVMTTGSEEDLKAAVGTAGPVAVGIDASLDTMHHYKSGVYSDKDCNQHANHAVLVVGYGTTEDKEDYWIVKNSWSPDWGDQGYINIARNQNNMCLIAEHCSYPVV